MATTLEELMKDFNKKFKEDLVHKGTPEYNYERIPFTSPRLNYMTHGGLPKGKLIEFFGEEHGGKTTTALDVVANFQHSDDGRRVLWVDCENTLDKVWANKLGVDMEEVILLQPTEQSAEALFQFILDSIKTGEVGLVVIDSLGVMESETSLDKDMDEKTYGGIAMALTRFSKRAVGLCQRNKCTLIGLNQLRDKIGSMYGGTDTTGGRAWKHNCFSGNTKFVTDKGLRRFRDCIDGEEVNVIDCNGDLRKATVHYFGVNKLQRVKLHTSNMNYEVICTSNHRWLLADGTVTESLEVGDKLYYRPENIPNEPKTQRECEMFCLGLAIADGTDYVCKKSVGIRVVLCGDKVKYSNIFEKACYRKASQGKYVGYQKLHISKQAFLNGECWKYLCAEDLRFLFAGYMTGDGSGNSCVTHDERVHKFICYSCNMAGYFITSDKEYVTNDKSYKPGVIAHKIQFTTHTNKYNGWVVEEITPCEYGGTYCVEEPITHTFTLEKGIVTGNCSVRLEFRMGKFVDDKNKELTRGAENPAGNIVFVSMPKNKTCAPDRRVGFYTLKYLDGIDYISDLIEVAIRCGIIEKAGAWYTILNPTTGEIIAEKIQGQAGVQKILEDDEDTLTTVEELVEVISESEDIDLEEDVEE